MSSPDQQFEERTDGDVYEARQRGVRPIRRRVHSESFELLDYIASELESISEEVSCLIPRDILSTLVGISSMSLAHLRHGPKTSDVLKQVRNTRLDLEVSLGAIGLYGPSSNKRIGARLHSAEIHQEHEDLSTTFSMKGYPLSPNPFNTHGEFVPHITIASLGEYGIDDFQGRGRLDEINHLIGTIGEPLVLRGVKL